MKKMSKKICVALVTSILTMNSVSVSYAASRIDELVEKVKSSAKKSLEELQGGRPDDARVELKNVRLHIKEITRDVSEGDRNKLEKASQAIKETLRIMDEEKDNKKAIETLGPAIQLLEEIPCCKIK